VIITTDNNDPSLHNKSQGNEHQKRCIFRLLQKTGRHGVDKTRPGKQQYLLISPQKNYIPWNQQAVETLMPTWLWCYLQTENDHEQLRLWNTAQPMVHKALITVLHWLQ